MYAMPFKYRFAALDYLFEQLSSGLSKAQLTLGGVMERKDLNTTTNPPFLITLSYFRMLLHHCTRH